MKRAVISTMLAVASFAASADVLVYDYVPQPGVRLRLTNSHSPACGDKMPAGQFVHLPTGTTDEMCWHLDDVTRRVIVFYPDTRTLRAFAVEDLREVAKFK